MAGTHRRFTSADGSNAKGQIRKRVFGVKESVDPKSTTTTERSSASTH